jgi:hypothetical protein
MISEALEQSLNVIKDYISGIKELREDREVQLFRYQLRVIEKTIRQLEKDGIQVPEGVMSDKISLEAKIKEIKRGPQEISLLYEELIDIVVKAGRIIRRRPDKDLRRKLKEERKQELPREVLRKNIIAVLRELGGRGRERDILKEIEDRLGAQFSSADLERPYGRSARWHTNVRKERNLMIKEGILTSDSIRKKWTLIK